jgi:hypothetical protein
MARSSVTAAMSFLARSWGCAWVGVDALAGLLAQLTRVFAARGGFPSDGGAKYSHRVVLFCEFGLELTCLS